MEENTLTFEGMKSGNWGKLWDGDQRLSFSQQEDTCMFIEGSHYVNGKQLQETAIKERASFFIDYIANSFDDGGLVMLIHLCSKPEKHSQERWLKDIIASMSGPKSKAGKANGEPSERIAEIGGILTPQEKKALANVIGIFSRSVRHEIACNFNELCVTFFPPIVVTSVDVEQVFEADASVSQVLFCRECFKVMLKRQSYMLHTSSRKRKRTAPSALQMATIKSDDEAPLNIENHGGALLVDQKKTEPSKPKCLDEDSAKKKSRMMKPAEMDTLKFNFLYSLHPCMFCIHRPSQRRQHRCTAAHPPVD